MKKKKKPIFSAKDLNLDAIIINTNKVIQKRMPWIKTPEPSPGLRKRKKGLRKKQYNVDTLSANARNSTPQY